MDQSAAFLRLWQRLSPHLYDIKFDFGKERWAAADIDALGELVCCYEHRFSHQSTDLGHATVDPFRIILKSDARPVKQRPYRPSPAITTKVQTETDKLVLGLGFLGTIFSNCWSPLVVIAKADGRI